MRSEIIIIFGKRGSGKTTLAKDLIESETRLIIFDPLIEYSNYGRVFTEINGLFNYIKNYSTGYFKGVYQPEINLTQAYDLCCEIIYCLYDVVFLCEEIDIATSYNYTPPSLERLICHGRHKNISLIAITRRPPEIPKLLTSQASKMITFKQHEPGDLEYLAKSGLQDHIEKIKSLKQYQYLTYDLSNGEIKVS